MIDLARDGDRYGTIVATTPVGEKGLWPHHTEHELGASNMLFANGFSANRNLLFDLHDPLHPKVVERFNGAAGLNFLHSIVRLPNGHVLATFQARDSGNVSPGGLAELDEKRPRRPITVRRGSVGGSGNAASVQPRRGPVARSRRRRVDIYANSHMASASPIHRARP